MERDFLGLNDKQYLSNVKHEVNDAGVRERGLSKKEARQLGKAKVFATSNFQEAKPFPGAYQWGSVSAASVFRKGQFGGAFQNVKPLLLGGAVPLPTHPSLVVPRVASSEPSPQLTIFYAGNVNVFNDISPDKAQAILLCAAKGMKGETGENRLMIQQPVRETERVYGKHNTTTAASSSSATHTDNISRCRDKPGAATYAMSMVESFNASPGSMMIPSVPQARKASLARFLEKRKERLMSAMPYKTKLLELSTGESSGMNYSCTSPT